MSEHRATIRRDRGGGWRYRVYAGSENIDTSESYTRRWSALRALRANRPDVVAVRIFDRDDQLDRTKVLRRAG